MAGEDSLYVADTRNSRVVHVGSDGTVRSVSTADLRLPEDVAVAGDGSGLVTDTGNDRLRRPAPDHQSIRDTLVLPAGWRQPAGMWAGTIGTSALRSGTYVVEARARNTAGASGTARDTFSVIGHANATAAQLCPGHVLPETPEAQGSPTSPAHRRAMTGSSAASSARKSRVCTTP